MLTHALNQPSAQYLRNEVAKPGGADDEQQQVEDKQRQIEGVSGKVKRNGRVHPFEVARSAEQGKKR